MIWPFRSPPSIACAASAGEEIGRMSEGIVFAKDLRYMQVRLSDDYLRLADKFSF